MERILKLQEVILKAMAGKLTWVAAAEIIGVTDRTMRRWRERWQEHGYSGLWDYRKQQPSPKRVPVEQLEQVLQLYREKYFDFNVQHFHEKLVEVHDVHFSYTWVRTALQEAGLVKRRKKRGSHRKRRPRRPLPGNDAAHRRQRAPVVQGRALLRTAGDHGRRNQRDLLRATGGGRVNAERDGSTAGGD